MPAPTLADATAFVLNDATDEDLHRLVAAIRQRRYVLREVTAAAVRSGAEVSLTGLKPKYLNGLSGTVAEINGRRATVLLDVESTERLRYDGRRMHFIPDSVERHKLEGVPLTLCKTT